jgi:hypothetical protein
MKDATAISQALITAGGLVSVTLNVFKRSPVQPTAPLIDFRVALTLTPVVLVRARLSHLHSAGWGQALTGNG